MTSGDDRERFARIAAIVEECLELALEEREQALLEACGDDDDLLRECRELLAASEAADDLATPAIGLQSDDTTPDDVTLDATEATGPSAPRHSPLPQSIGPYRILGELGRGGMGTVYLAEQSEVVKRQVALKVASGRIDEATQLRLEAERQAMARLSHANVAQIFEGGTTEEGNPYFAMELVDGPPVTRFCDEQRLSIDDRIRLFLRICAGIEHAHQNGIIHRDIKPSNILVHSGGDGEPKIIDFGIAKATAGRLLDESMHTANFILGTPAYLSPEAIGGPSKARSHVDTRSDVYSLGVLLQELLIGQRLTREEEGESAIALLRRVLDEDPPTLTARWRELEDTERQEATQSRQTEPSSLLRRIRGDLEWIVRKATAKTKEERYASVAELAADLKRHLDHEPVLAGPPTSAYRLKKFVRKHRTVAGFSVLLLLALVGGLIARTIEAQRANREAERANLAVSETESVVGFLTGLFAEADPTRALGRDPTATELLNRGLEELEGEALVDRPRIRARILNTLSEVFRSLGQPQRAYELADEALRIRSAEFGRRSDETSQALLLVGTLANEVDEFDRSERLLREALSIREEIYGTEALEISQTLTNLGALLEETDRREEALPLVERSLAIQSEHLGEVSEEVGKVLNNLSILYRRLGRPEESEETMRRSIEIKRQVLDPNHPGLADSLVNFANFLAATGRYDEAQPLLEEALGIEETSLGKEHPNYGMTLNSLGTMDRTLGDFETARARFEESRDVLLAAYGPDHIRVAYPTYNLGGHFEATGEYPEAIRWHREALRIRRVAGSRESSIAASLGRLAKVLRLNGENREALANVREALSLLADHPVLSPRVKLLRSEAGLLALESGDLEAAEEHFRFAVDQEIPLSEVAGQAYGSAWIGLGRIAMLGGDRATAIERIREGIGFFEPIYAPNHAEVLDARRLLEQLESEGGDGP